MAEFNELTGLDTIQNLSHQVSPALVNAFELYIPNMPGGGDSTPLRLRLTTCDNPISMEVSVVDLHTKRWYYKFAGALKPKQELNCSFQESANGSVTSALDKWQQTAVSYQSGYNYSKTRYATTAYLYLIGVNEKYFAEIPMRNFWLSSHEQDSLEQNREKNDIINVKAKFIFDFIDFPVKFVATE